MHSRSKKRKQASEQAKQVLHCEGTRMQLPTYLLYRRPRRAKEKRMNYGRYTNALSVFIAVSKRREAGASAYALKQFCVTSPLRIELALITKPKRPIERSRSHAQWRIYNLFKGAYNSQEVVPHKLKRFFECVH